MSVIGKKSELMNRLNNIDPKTVKPELKVVKPVKCEEEKSFDKKVKLMKITELKAALEEKGENRQQN